MSDLVRQFAKLMSEPAGIRRAPPPPGPPPARPAVAIAKKGYEDFSVPPSAPPVPDGHVRLYRAEAVVPEKPVMPGWLQEAWAKSGALDARGRWYTDKPETLGFYLQDQAPHGRVFFVDMPSSAHEAFRVRNYAPAPGDLVNPRNFSRDQDTEFFIPREWAAKRSLLEP